MDKNYVERRLGDLFAATFQAGPSVPEYHLQVIRYAVSAYGFLLAYKERLSFPQFAARIAEYYDTSVNERNREVVRVLRLYPPA